MQAVWVEALADDLSGVALRDVPLPEKTEGEVLVRVRAAALNHPDLLMTRGAYQFKPPLPFIAGMEMAGEVVKADAASGFAPGDRVMGGVKTGCFAQYCSVPASALAPLPALLAYPAAAALGVAYRTAYTALVEIGRLRAGQWVLVHGASGGVGMAACDLATALGARVIATTHRLDKVERLAAAVRADNVIVNSGRFRDAVAAITDGALCDIVFDPVGGDVFDESTRCVAFDGQLQVIGFVAGRIASVAANIPLIKGFSVVGIRAGEYARRFPERGAAIGEAIARLADEGRIAPVIDRTLPLSDWHTGYTAMQAGELFGKVVFEP